MNRILNVLYEERLGGPQLRVLQVARGLKVHGYETIVALPKGDPPFAQLLAQHGISFRELNLVRPRRSFDPRLHARFALRFWSNVAELRQMIRNERIEIVHTNGLANLQAALAARREGVALVWHLNDVCTPKLLRAALLPLVRRWADRIAVAARAVTDYCFPGDSRLAERIQLLYAPVDTQRFNPRVDGTRVRRELGIAPDCPLIGLVANLCPGKGQEYFLEAAPLVLRRYPQAKFMLAGARLENRRAFWEGLQQQIARLRLEGEVIFTGRRSDVPQLLRAMTVCVQASESEACPMAMLEASASGTAVVATRVGGTPEIVEHGVTGILIDPRKPAQISRAVLHLLDAPAIAQQMGLAGARRMQERFSLETCVEAHARMYGRALSHAGSLEPANVSALPPAESVEDVYSRN